MIKKIFPIVIRNYLSFLRKVGFGKFFLNFLVQRVFRINSQVKTQVHFTSTFIGNDLHYDKNDLSVKTSLAVSGSLYIQSLNGVYVGKNVLIAPGVKIISANHSLKLDRKPQKSEPIIIGDNVWLGASSIVLPGVEIGHGCVIGAGSVLTKTIMGENLVIAGNPAKIIKEVNK